MENKLEVLRRKVDKLINCIPQDKQRYYTVHLYGVSHFAAMLAIRRGLDPEIASVCGMLHDIGPVICGNYEDHAARGSLEARKILQSIGMFSDPEIDLITTAIAWHNDKGVVNLPYDELLKDADVLHHCLYDTSMTVAAKEQNRYDHLLIELGCGFCIVS
jgi:HD superfamily phosphohydrolase YqeK